MKFRLPQMILEELERGGVPWRIEMGGRHRKLFVGNHFVTILPFGRSAHQTTDMRANLNVRAHIRRALRDIKREEKT